MVERVQPRRGARLADEHQLPHQGTLYVTLFDQGDMVNDHGGGECNGRGLLPIRARGENVPVTGVQGFTSSGKHATTVHTFDVICKALYAAAALPLAHRTDLRPTSPGQRHADHPTPAPATAMLALDLSGSMSLRPARPAPRGSKCSRRRSRSSLTSG